MNDETNKIKIQKIVRGIKRISTIPTVFSKINELMNNPRSRASDFSKVISGDPALTVKLLKLVNSVFFGLPVKVDSVSRAITIVGLKQLRELVLATSVMQMFKGKNEKFPFSMENFWRHCLGCGVASRVLAIYKQEKNPESFFVAGLLHDIGRLIMLEGCFDEYQQVFSIVEEKHTLMAEAEKSVFGFTHADVGKELVITWKLPESLEQAVGYHHDPDYVEPSNYIDIVHIANILVHATRLGLNGEKYVPPMNAGAWDRLGFKESILEPALEKIYEQFEDAVAYLLV